MTTRIALLAALGSLLLATPALADRAGDAPLRAPLMLQTDHIAFTLQGAGWAQVLGTMEGTPAFGEYALDGKTPSGTSCQLSASVTGVASARRPVIRGRTVNLRPGTRSSAALRVTSQGRHGAVQWWSGTMRDVDAGAGGVQRLPQRLATPKRPYLVYSVTIRSATYPEDKGQCAAHARRSGARIAQRIARTMRIAGGPPVSRPPSIS